MTSISNYHLVFVKVIMTQQSDSVTLSISTWQRATPTMSVHYCHHTILAEHTVQMSATCTHCNI